MTREKSGKPGERRGVKALLSVIFAIIAVIYILPIIIVAVNSFKLTTEITASPFTLPMDESFVGFQNYIKGMTEGQYPFYKAVINSLVITILSTAAILIFTSMCAWYIVRVKSFVSRLFYYLCAILCSNGRF